METITLYKDTYEAIVDREFKQMMELATLKGKIRALSTMDDMPEFVLRELKEIAAEFEKEVDIA